MHTVKLSAEELISRSLRLPDSAGLCILDSCGVGHLGSHLLIVGMEPVEIIEVSSDYPESILSVLDNNFASDLASIFTLSYTFGERLNGIAGRDGTTSRIVEPGLFIASFEVLIVHDYDSGLTRLAGKTERFPVIENQLARAAVPRNKAAPPTAAAARSNFTKEEYLAAIEAIRERIRCGDTYQTNLTQQLTVPLPGGITPADVFERLRRDHPAPFAAFLRRGDSTVISASPERFFRVSHTDDARDSPRIIETSPIKGTRPRGSSDAGDRALRRELLNSEKDRAENTMIVDLLRNDLGRVCEYGSVRVEKLCDLEEHPSLFHLVSTVSGRLRSEIRTSDIIRALFPCGSITGAPKISTMGIISEIESEDRGLSMGAIGYHIPNDSFGLPAVTDLSVAIRTIVVRDKIAAFNVGGGIVIGSDPETEYDESLLKAQALLHALCADFIAEA